MRFTAHFVAYREIHGTLLELLRNVAPLLPLGSFNRCVANQSKALGDEWNYGAIPLEFSQPDFGAKQ